MPRDGYRERAAALRRFIDRWRLKGNRFLATYRVLDYGEELSGLQRIEIQPLNDQQIRTFLQNELPGDWATLWQILVGDVSPLQLPPKGGEKNPLPPPRRGRVGVGASPRCGAGPG
ncbi:MAG: hypothetical protein DPW09_43725 [Anaerolineae bacterium]|nr:hypothetical protein [Anaerolineales bacterium]MCQ3980372.1 hypothetical protein [Anaerolineae bacterium]